MVTEQGLNSSDREEWKENMSGCQAARDWDVKRKRRNAKTEKEEEIATGDQR